MRRAAIALLVLAGCGGRAASRGTAVTLREACADDQRWVATACVPGPAAAIAAVAANDELILADPVAALAVVDASASRGPFDRSTYARLWRQRGMAHALLAYAAAAEGRDDPTVAEAMAAEQAEHEREARAAFDMLLALDPQHRLEYTQSPQTTFVFQSAIADAATRPAPAIDVDWKRDLRVGDAIPVDIEVIADPKSFLARAVLFVRHRGDPTWRAAELELPTAGGYRRVVLPAVTADAASAVDLYLRAYDAEGNEVLGWASPERPREVPLRWDPPTPWWRKWWVWAIAGSVVAGGTGIAVYAAQWEPSDDVGGTVSVGQR